MKLFKSRPEPEDAEMDEIGLDGFDFKLHVDGENYTLVFAEIFPDDAGLYKVFEK